ncbi:MAG TPA: hypothetical protein VFA44_07310 [Gaiellaceae bacterium]|nr:hypothetical protein [Gaiellaceae bacterium]
MMAAPNELLAEVPESAAAGRVAELYADIRAVLGVPVVNLVYRHLAVEPVRLASVWEALRPNLTSYPAEEASRQLIERAAVLQLNRVPPAALAAVGISAECTRLVRATLAAYARANSRNLLGMHALLYGCSGTGARAATSEFSPGPAVLPMVPLESADEGTSKLLHEMSAALVGDEHPVLVPSLLRHLAASPPLLALVWTVLRPATGEPLAHTRDAVTETARSLVARLPHPVRALERAEDRDVARRFAAAMSTLLVTGEAIRLALSEAP